MTTMSKRAQQRLRFVSALVAALVVVPGATAQAKAGPSHDQTSGPNAPAHHCVINLSTGGRQKCFTSFRASIASATHGRVTDAPNDVKTAMASRRFAAELNLSTRSHANSRPSILSWGSPPNVRLGPGPYVVGIAYENSNLQGASLTLTGSHPCTYTPNDVDYQVPSLSTYGWDNVISSFRGSATCWMNLFENDWFGGAQTGLQWGMNYVGDAMNDQTSSIQLT